MITYSAAKRATGRESSQGSSAVWADAELGVIVADTDMDGDAFELETSVLVPLALWENPG